ncbi:MAG: ABC transporter substrate-binding protein [Desulfitobacteriaceae bacterium]
MRKKAFIYLAVFALLLTMLAGCGQPAAQNAGGAAKGKVISIGMSYDMSNLDPATLTSVTDGQIAYNLYDSLVFNNIQTGKLEGGLAETYNISSDGKVYTFNLRKGVKFQKGYGEMTADDVKFSFDRILDPKTGARNRVMLSSIQEVKVLDPYKVEIDLKNPDPMFLNNLSDYWTGIISKKAIQEKGKKFSQDPIGTGPFQFDHWTAATETVLVKNPDWYRGGVKLDKVRFVPIPEASTMYLAFEKGDVDVIQVTDPERLAQYSKDTAKYQISQVPGYIVRFIGMNNKMKPFDDVRVRQALEYGFDRDTLLKTVLANLSTPATGPLPSNVFGYDGNVTKYPYDPDKAKELLKEAGYPNGFTTSMLIPNIDRFIKPATAFQADMKKIGVTVNISVMETAAYLAKVREGNTPLFSHSKNESAVPDLVLQQLFDSRSLPPGDNLTKYTNPQVDQWIREAAVTLDENKRKALFSKIQKQIADDASYLFIDHEDYIFALNKRVQGFVSTPLRSLQVYTVDLTN